MNKAASTSAVDRLGTKRHCPKCATKFYDFNKEEIACPKCGTEIDTSVEVAIPIAKPVAPEPKKAVRVATSDEEGEEDTASASDFETIDDLDADEEDLVEDIEVDEDDDEEEF